MGAADIESSISIRSEKQFEEISNNEKKKVLNRSVTPHLKQIERDSNSMTPTRSGRSVTPFSLYLIRHNPDSIDPPKWRSITPFLYRKDKEKTPFELGKDLKSQLIAHKMVFDRASVMDITDESNYEPSRFITSDSAVIDRASIMDISNVEVVYLIEEYDQNSESVVPDEDSQTKEKKKSKRVKKLRNTETSDKSNSIEKDISPGGSVEKKISKTKKKINEKKKKEKSDSDDDISPPPSPPKLSLKLELGGGPKVNKKLFENKEEPETKPPVKKTKQELEKSKADSVAVVKENSEKKMKKEEESIVSLENDDVNSIKSENISNRRTPSITEVNVLDISGNDNSVDVTETNELSNSCISTSIDKENLIENNYESVDQGTVYDEKDVIEHILNNAKIIEDKIKTPTPPSPSPLPPPRRRSPSPALPTKQPESYYNRITKQFGEHFSNQIRMFNSVKRDKPHHPAFIVKLKDLCVTETDNIEISCAIYGSNISYKWFKDDIILNNSDRVKFIENENILTLKILNSRPKDTADYKLKISNEYKTIECISYVNVAEMGGYQDEPCPPDIESIQDYFHFIDDKLMIEAKIKGIPRVKLTWYKDDMQIHDWMPEYTFMEEPHGRNILIINNPTEKDIGIYTLHAQNDRGTHIRKYCVEFLAQRPKTSSKLAYRTWRFLC